MANFEFIRLSTQLPTFDGTFLVTAAELENTGHVVPQPKLPATIIEDATTAELDVKPAPDGIDDVGGDNELYFTPVPKITPERFSPKFKKRVRIASGALAVAFGLPVVDLGASLLFWDQPREPSVTQHTVDCTNAKFIYDKSPGTGLPTGHHTAAIFGPTVEKYGGCMLSTDFGTRLSDVKTTELLLKKIDESGIKPAESGFIEIVIDGDSAGGIYAKKAANAIASLPGGMTDLVPGKKFHVIALNLNATPYNSDSIIDKPAEWETRNCVPFGKGTGVLINAGGVIKRRESFLDWIVLRDMGINAGLTSGMLSSQQACSVFLGYPDSVKGENSTKFYEYSVDDDTVNGAHAFSHINRVEGGGVILNMLYDTGHTTQWLDWQSWKYMPNYELRLRQIRRLVEPRAYAYRNIPRAEP